MVYGGYGADTFDVDLMLDVVSFPQAVADLSGGAGRDVFDLNVQQGDVSLEFPETDDTSRGLINIADFQPGIDQLLLDVGGAAVTLSEAADGSFTDVILTYPATATAPSGQGVIHLAGETGLTMDDLVVQGAAAA